MIETKTEEHIREQIKVVEAAEKALLRTKVLHKGTEEAERHLEEERTKLKVMDAEVLARIEEEVKHELPSFEKRHQELLNVLRKQVGSLKKLLKVTSEIAETIESLRQNAIEAERVLGKLSPVQGNEALKLIGEEQGKVRGQVLFERRERYPALQVLDISLVYELREAMGLIEGIIKKLEKNE